MSNNLLPILWGEAQIYSDRDAFVSDWALSSVWNDAPETEIPPERIEWLGQIWDAAHMSVKEICKTVGMTQTAVGQYFGIRWRTFSDWCRGVARCPSHVRMMMCELLGIIHR